MLSNGDPLLKDLQKQISGLPPHLQLDVLSRVPLLTCLLRLGPAWHATALRAHHPSIDSNNSLHLSPLPPHALPAALDALSTLSNLSSLAFPAATIPPSTPFSPLQHLTGFTELDVSDTGLVEDSACALAAVLPALRSLREFNASNNALTHASLQALDVALPQCTALRTLNMLSTFCISRDLKQMRNDVLDTLALLCSKLMSIEQLCLSELEPPDIVIQDRGLLSDAVDNGVVALFDAISALPCLRYLHVDTRARGLCSPNSADRMIALQRMTGFLPQFANTGPDTPATRDLHRGVFQAWASLPMLSSLALMCPMCPHPLKELRLLTNLTRLVLSVFRSGADQSDAAVFGTALAGALSHLQGLREFRIDSDALAHPHGGDAIPRLQHTAQPVFLGAFVDVVCALPLLSLLAIPISTEARCSELILPTILRWNQEEHRHLVIDLYVIRPSEDPEPVSDEVAEPFVPLLMHVQSMTIDIEADDAWMAPLVAAIPQMTALERCYILSLDVQIQCSVVGVLHALVPLPGLRELGLRMVGNDKQAADNIVQVMTGFRAQLLKMTCLESFGMEAISWQWEGDFVSPHITGLVAACAGLTRLRRLRLGWNVYLGEAKGEVAHALSRLHVRTLVLVASECGAFMHQVVPRLVHLGRVYVRPEWRRDNLKEAVRRAVSSIPQCRVE